MKLEPASIGFDFDGVIADTLEAFLRIACERYTRCDIRLTDITDFFVERCLDMKAEIIDAIFQEILRDSVESGLRPMPGVVEALGWFSRRAPVTIITARPEPEPVRAWLHHFFPEEVRQRIHLVATGDHDGKASHIRNAGLSAFIDDRAETCLELHKTGIRTIVFDQPWNQGRHSLPIVRGWQEILSLCGG